MALEAQNEGFFLLEVKMPATSEAQRTMFCIALSIKRGKTPKSYSKQAAKMAETMGEEQLKDYCESPIKK